MRPMRIPCSIAIKKTGSQSKNGWSTPKIARKLSRMILRFSGKPRILKSSNLARPLESIFMRNPKKRKLGIKPYQKRFSLVAKRMPCPARLKPSSHFLQFI